MADESKPESPAEALGKLKASGEGVHVAMKGKGATAQDLADFYTALSGKEVAPEGMKEFEQAIARVAAKRHGCEPLP